MNIRGKGSTTSATSSGGQRAYFSFMWGAAKIRGTLLGGPNGIDHCILESKSGSPYLWK